MASDGANFQRELSGQRELLNSFKFDDSEVYDRPVQEGVLGLVVCPGL